MSAVEGKHTDTQGEMWSEMDTIAGEVCQAEGT